MQKSHSLILENRKSIILFFIILIFVSVFLVSKIEIFMYPKMSKPHVIMAIRRTGYSVSAFYKDFDYVENKLKNLKNVERVEGNHTSSRSRYDIYFDWSLDNEEAKKRVQTVADEVKNSLPSEYKDNVSVYDSARSSGNLLATVSSKDKNANANDIYNNLKSYLQMDLKAISGAENIYLLKPENILPSIHVFESKLIFYGLSYKDVQRAMSSVGITSLGSFRDKHNVVQVSIQSSIDSEKELKNLLIKNINGTNIYLKDIADVKIEYTYPWQIFRINDKGAVIIYASPKSDANVRKFSSDIKDLIEKKQKINPKLNNLTFNYVLDPADFINNSVSSVLYSALTGTCLSIIIVFLILGELKNTIIVGISIPLSIVYSFIFMYFFKITINLISLSGMTLSVGMVIDASIVSMENIHRLIQEHKDSSKIKVIIKKAMSQVRSSIIYSTLTSIVVFLPISFTSPLTNAILGEQAKTIIFALLSSLLVSLVFVPIISYIIYKNQHKFESKKNLSQKITDKLVVVYKSFLFKIINSKIISLFILACCLVFFVLSILFLFPNIKKEILGKPSGNNLIVGISNEDYSDPIEFLKQSYEPAKKKVMSKIKKSDIIMQADQITQGGNGTIIIRLKSSKKVESYIKELQNKFGEDESVSYSFSSWDPSELPLPYFYDFGISIKGQDGEEILNILNDLASYISNLKIEELQKNKDGKEVKKQNRIVRRIRMYPDAKESIISVNLKKRQGVGGFDNYDFIQNLVKKHLFASLGNLKTKFLKDEGGREDIRVDYEDKPLDVKDLKSILVPFKGTYIPISHIYDFEQKKIKDVIFTKDGRKSYQILGFFKNAKNQEDKKKYLNFLKQELEKYKIKDGYSIEYIQTDKELKENINSLFIALVSSIIIIYLILCFQFKSYFIPFIIILTVPLGFIGVLLSLFIFKSTVSLNSMLGSILLGGIVVNNAIMMIDFYQQIKKEHESFTKAIVLSASLRLLPILMTTLTTFTGMFPIALALGDGANVVQPLGIAVAGGLVFSTMLTLFVIPIILNLKEEFDFSRTKKVKFVSPKNQTDVKKDDDFYFDVLNEDGKAKKIQPKDIIEIDFVIKQKNEK